MTNNVNNSECIKENAGKLIQCLSASMERLVGAIDRSAEMITESIRNGGKVLVCGNGGSAADSQHLAAELVGRYLQTRRPYSAIALSTDTSVITSIANDFGFDSVFSKQVEALGKKGDVLVAISTSGSSPNVLKAIASAKIIDMTVIGMTGKGGGQMAGQVDILLDAESKETPRIQEIHAFMIHEICGMAERNLS